MGEGRGQRQVFLRLDGIDEDDSRVAAVGIAGGHPARCFFQLHVTDGLVIDGRGFTGELFVALDVDAGLAQPVPGPVALDGRRTCTHNQ